MTNDIRKAIDAVSGKVKLKEATATLGNVTVTADDTMLRILDLAGIARPAAVAAPMMDPMAAPMGGDAGLPAPVGDPMGGMMGPDEMPSTVDSVPGIGGDLGGGMEPELDAAPDMGMEPGADDIDADPAPMVGDVADDLVGDMGDDGSVFEPVDSPEDDSMEIDFETDPEMEMESAEEDEDPIEEGEAQQLARRYDHGNMNANIGQEPYRMDAHSFSGSAKKPVRFVPARSGDNPLVDPKKGLKAYMEAIEAERSLSEIEVDDLDNIVAKIDTKNNATAKRTVQDIASKMARDPISIKKDSPETILTTVRDQAKTKGVDLAKPINDLTTKLKKNPNDPAIADITNEDDLEEKRRNYSFRQTIMPFQGLTGAQRVSRAAIKLAKSRLR